MESHKRLVMDQGRGTGFHGSTSGVLLALHSVKRPPVLGGIFQPPDSVVFLSWSLGPYMKSVYREFCVLTIQSHPKSAET